MLKNWDYYKSISIIVPTYNAEKDIVSLIKSLLSIDYPKELLEIIVVDNNSTDETKNILKSYNIKILEENHIQSSYAARNKGIKHAKNEILAFVDSDCIVSPQWLKEGVRPFIEQSADLVGGNVEFYYSKKPTAAEMFDSITNMQIEYNIKERKIAKTANLFVKRELFDKIGLFPSTVTSGGDVQWTAKATRAGYKLVYAPEAIVKHPTRSLMELLKKQYRVGKGKMGALEAESRHSSKTSLLKQVIPKYSDIKKLVSERGTKEMQSKHFQIWFVSFMCNVATGFGIFANKMNKIWGK